MVVFIKFFSFIVFFFKKKSCFVQLYGILGRKKPRFFQIWGMRITKPCYVWIQLLLKPQSSWNPLKSGEDVKNYLLCHRVIAVGSWILVRFFMALFNLIYWVDRSFLENTLLVLFSVQYVCTYLLVHSLFCDIKVSQCYLKWLSQFCVIIFDPAFLGHRFEQ